MSDYKPMGVYTDEKLQFLKKVVQKYGPQWDTIAEIFNKKFKDDKSANAIRKTYRRYEDVDFSNTTILDKVRQTYNARKQRSTVTKENKELLEYFDSKDSFLEEFETILKSLPIQVHAPVKFPPKKSPTDRVIFAHLSDTHFQSQIDSEEVAGVNKYGNIEEARRLAFFFREVANYKLHRRENTELVLALNGDLGAGIIHSPESLPPMTTQVSAIIYLLSQGISFLATHFKKVTVVCTPGNHLRFMHKSEKGRQTDKKWDGFHTITYIALKYALQSHKNVEFNIPVSPVAIVDILGHKVAVLHGDTVLNVGNPGKTLSVQNINNHINNLISGLGRIDLAAVGHVHTPVYTTLNNGVHLAVNGCMSGIDNFAFSIGITKSNPTQQFFEITKQYVLGDMRFCYLNKADNEEELDKIIKPFSGKF